MSVEALSWAFKVKVASTAQKAVLLVLADIADEDGFCWPSQKLIAERSACSVRTVRTVMGEIEKVGLIKRSDRRRPNGSFSSDAIYLDIKNQRQILPAANFAVGKKRAQPAANIAAPEPTIEPTNISSNEDIAADAALPFEEKALTPAKAPPRKAKKTAKPKTPISEDWDVDADLIQHCADFGYSEREARFIAFKFKTHFESSGAVKTDWRRTFQVWVSNETPWKVKQAAAQWRQNGATSSINPKILNATPETQRYLCQRYIDDRFWPADGGPLFTGVTDEVLKEFGLSRHGAAA